MLCYVTAILVATFSHALATQTEVTGVPIKVSLCAGKTCPTPSPHLSCVKYYIPSGQCCPVCECQDNDGKTYAAGSEFLINQHSQCGKCFCKYSAGAVIAECHRMYCFPLECPPEDQITVEGSCCKRCKPGWVKPIRTFPPFPGGGFPQPGGGFPQPGGGFPPPFGDEGKIENISERKSMKKRED